jgi:hypothetical protein
MRGLFSAFFGVVDRNFGAFSGFFLTAFPESYAA